MAAQVTRDKLLREHMYSEKVDISTETGSGYPGGMPCLLAAKVKRRILVSG